MDSTSSPAENLPVYWVGQHESRRQLPVSPQTVRKAKDCNFEFLTTPITTPLFHSRVLALLSTQYSELKDGHLENHCPAVSSLSATDAAITPSDTISQLIGIASPWVDLSSPDPIVYNVSRQVLALEISYAAFCGLGNVVLPGPKLQYGSAHGEGVVQYACAIQELLALNSYTQILIHLPMMYHPDQDGDDVEGSLSSLFTRKEYIEEGGRYHQDLIHRYMRLRTPPWILLCDVGPIPGAPNAEATIPEPPKGNAFESAKASKDPEKTQQACTEIAQNEHRISQASTYNQNPKRYLDYIHRLQQETPQQSILEHFSAGFYQDYLQSPLQPLSDNLESVSYEVFEKDPVKYERYESAIRRALSDWKSANKTTSSPSGTVVVAVVGAGRGPLVTRALQASKAAGVKIELWAIEKNPNAFVLLQHHNEHTWSNQVHLVQSDMRSWQGPFSTLPPQQQHYQTHHPHAQSHHHQERSQPHKIDILISELLGSFADNELSPECLDPLIHSLLNPIHGISIPASYTSHLTPICAPKLHADIAARTPNDPLAPNTPYVVMLHAIDYLSTLPPSNPSSVTAVVPIIKPVWRFEHTSSKNKSTNNNTTSDDESHRQNDNKHNTRSTRLTFPIPHRGCIHGLAGYFEAVLYDDVELSTHPLFTEDKSRDMTSWFPIYFPLKTPLYIPDSSSLTVTMRRCTDARKVWYEWMVESFFDPSSPSPASPPVSGSGSGSGDMNRDSAGSGMTGVSKGTEKSKGMGMEKKGKKVRLGISEVGSSRDCGCVM
ncbi:MAG: hypothetical protein Q9221_004698 [Calogaya cf. arnoldii]